MTVMPMNMTLKLAEVSTDDSHDSLSSIDDNSDDVVERVYTVWKT